MREGAAPTLRARNPSRLMARAEAAALSMPSDKIPVIHIGPLFNGDAPAVGAEIQTACIEVGFFYVCGHSVDPAIRVAAFDAAGRFFDLPKEAKDAVSNRHSDVMRGYAGLLEENTDPYNDGDLHEAFDAALDLVPDERSRSLESPSRDQSDWTAALLDPGLLKHQSAGDDRCPSKMSVSRPARALRTRGCRSLCRGLHAGRLRPDSRQKINQKNTNRRVR
ncbi:MAG: 2-oxoglutarate and iron-dependent oxygenase domain-containing protein [Pseudomonadota bacterium]